MNPQTLPPMIFHGKYYLNHNPSKSIPHITKHNFHAAKHLASIQQSEQQTKQQTNTRQLLTAAAAPIPQKIVFPASFSLSSKYTLTILDQGNLGSCVATSYAGIIHSLYGKNLSRLYSYYNARVGTGNPPNQDTGLDLLQSWRIFRSFGIVPESNWEYVTSNYSTIPPFATTYKIADTSIMPPIQSITQTDDSIKTVLSNGSFIMLGIIVYSSFMTSTVARTGIIPMPNTRTERSAGGHCIHIVGWCTYNKTTYYIIRNSWGADWGNDGNPNPTKLFINNGKNGGFAYIPTAYILNTKLAFELISISK
jgi:C1A family cysteine protease